MIPFKVMSELSLDSIGLKDSSYAESLKKMFVEYSWNGNFLLYNLISDLGT